MSKGDRLKTAQWSYKPKVRKSMSKLPEPTPPTETAKELCANCGYDYGYHTVKGNFCIANFRTQWSPEVKDVSKNQRNSNTSPEYVQETNISPPTETQDEVIECPSCRRISPSVVCPVCGRDNIDLFEMTYSVAAPTERVETSLELELDLSQEIRLELWVNHQCQGKYGDDGEMQCNCFYPMIDFKRDFPSEILAKSLLHRIQLSRAAVAPSPAGESQEEK